MGPPVREITGDKNLLAVMRVEEKKGDLKLLT